MADGSACCQVTVTAGTAEEATALLRSAVEARLAAAGEVLGPMMEARWRNGRVDMERGWTVRLLTTESRADELVAYLRAQHADPLPGIVTTPVCGGNIEYLSWVRDQAGGR
jgi:periplasmic divalent cation tolerance protein